MNKIKIIFLILTFPLVCKGQMKNYEFNKNDLVNYKKIIANQIDYYQENDSSMRQSIYYLDKKGNIIKSESFENDTLRHYAINDFDTKGRIISHKSYFEIYTYNEDIGDHTPEWNDKYYNGSDFIYNEDQLIEERIFNYVDGEKSYDYIYKFKYDKDGKLINTQFIDLYKGLTGTFLPNTAIIDSLFNKEDITITNTYYEYRNDSVIGINYGTKNIITGYEFEILNENGLPIEFQSADSEGSVYIIYRSRYNELNKLIEKSREIIDYSKINYDLTAEDNYVIKYNQNGLPESGISYWKGEIISKRTLKYE
ncbi:hypothetical protein [Marinigracilibium pacificum]|uniref:Uncharacterized protein n=1 Tax=Marinigracilibium pacificum TaxID=2729599 RepID=A0A848J4S4_9BACT|nr:hypothetical protein [Marinigracilibium pacificum]NMM50771.1 hypothetical protein [Marinigracilibium pacificum]